MENERKYIFKDEQIMTTEGEVLKQPALLLSRRDEFFRMGEYEEIMRLEETTRAAFIYSGMPDEAAGLVTLSLSDAYNLTKYETFYILKQAQNLAGKGFIPLLLNNIKDFHLFHDWLVLYMLTNQLSEK